MKMVALENSLAAMPLEELFNEAAKYGRVQVHSSDSAEHPSCYNVVIRFDTRAHTTMEAKSAYCMPLKSALIQAISNAEDMVGVALAIGR